VKLWRDGESRGVGRDTDWDRREHSRRPSGGAGAAGSPHPGHDVGRHRHGRPDPRPHRAAPSQARRAGGAQHRHRRGRGGGTALGVAIARAGWPVVAVASRDAGRRERFEAWSPCPRLRGTGGHPGRSGAGNPCRARRRHPVGRRVDASLQRPGPGPHKRPARRRSPPARPCRREPDRRLPSARLVHLGCGAVRRGDQGRDDRPGGRRSFDGAARRPRGSAGRGPGPPAARSKPAYHAAAILASGGLVALLDAVVTMGAAAGMDERARSPSTAASWSRPLPTRARSASMPPSPARFPGATPAPSRPIWPRSSASLRTPWSSIWRPHEESSDSWRPAHPVTGAAGTCSDRACKACLTGYDWGHAAQHCGEVRGQAGCLLRPAAGASGSGDSGFTPASASSVRPRA